MDKFIAGAVAGMVTTTAMHPLEITKVRLQLGQVKSFRSGIVELVKNPQDAYRGLLPNFLGNTIAWGAYFYAYENIQKIAFGPLHYTPNTTTHWVCSFLAGFMTQVVTNPIWVVKTHILGTKKGEKGAVNGVSGAVKLVYTKWGLPGFWRGFVPGLFGTVQSAIYFSMYSPMKPALKQFGLSDAQTYFIASASCKCLSTALMYPYQPVRAEMQFRGFTFRQALGSLTRNGGWMALYRGLSANLLRVVPAMVVTSMTYENVRKILQ